MDYFIDFETAKTRTNELVSSTCHQFQKFLHHFDSSKSVSFLQPTIMWRSMGTRVAGRCYLQKNVIELNKNYLSSIDYKEFLKYTVLHELAHAIAWQIFQEDGHGLPWKTVAKFIGDDGETRHNMAIPIISKVERLSDRLK